MAHIGYGILYLFTSSEVLAFALVAFVVHHPDACKHEQYGHDKVEYTIAVRQGPEYIDPEPFLSVTTANVTATVKVFLFIGRIIKLVSILGPVTQQPWDGRCPGRQLPCSQMNLIRTRRISSSV